MGRKRTAGPEEERERRGEEVERELKALLYERVRVDRTSARELSSRLGYAKNYLSTALRGPTPPLRVSTFIDLADFLDADPLDLLARVIEPPATAAQVATAELDAALAARDGDRVGALLADPPALEESDLDRVLEAAMRLGAELERTGLMSEDRGRMLSALRRQRDSA